MKTDFQIGDIVQRIEGCHAGMHIHDKDEVIDIKDSGSLVLKNYDPSSSHDDNNFKLIKRNTTYDIF